MILLIDLYWLINKDKLLVRLNCIIKNNKSMINTTSNIPIISQLTSSFRFMFDH